MTEGYSWERQPTVSLCKAPGSVSSTLRWMSEWAMQAQMMSKVNSRQKVKREWLCVIFGHFVCIVRLVKSAKWPVVAKDILVFNCFQSLPSPISPIIFIDGKERVMGTSVFCHCSYCPGRHAGGHLQPSEAGYRRTIWSLHLGPSKRKVMKTGFSVSFFHGLTSLPCPGVCLHCSFHTDSDPRVGSLPIFDI